MRLIGPIFIFMLLATGSGCDQKPAQSDRLAEEPVLARVDKSLILQSQFDVMLERLAATVPQQNKAEISEKILQGIVRTRALADVSEQQLSDDEVKNLNARVKIYRDELLVESYIRRNIKAQPVSVEMVQQYYQSHLDEYKTSGKIHFEFLVTTARTLDDAALTRVMDAFSKAKNIDDWKSYAATLKQLQMPIEYNAVSMLPGSINQLLHAALGKLDDAQVSDLVFGDFVYVIKLLKREPDRVKPLHEVSAEIRRKLAPQQLKNMLSEHIDKALQGKSVEYMK